MSSVTRRTLFYVVVIVLISFPIFGNLNVMAIRIWDESRYAMNAYEMNKSGNWLVTTYEQSPDMWNTKPPLMIWLQVIFIKLIGAGELALRLPSAIAAFLTCLGILVLTIRYLNDRIFGLIALIVLVTSYGYIDVHSTRTGDMDSLLTFFITLSALSFFAFIESKNIKFLYLFFVALALGTLTKSIAALLFLPGLFFYILWRKQVIGILKNYHFYIGIIIFLTAVLSYYLLREHYNPGYLKAVQANEMGGRYLKVVERNLKGSDWFYYNLLIDSHFTAWYLLIPCGLLAGWLSKDERLKRLTVFLTTCIVTYLLVISISKTKTYWYDVPLYPFMALTIAIFLNAVFNALKNVKYFNATLTYNVIPFVFIFLVTIDPYHKIIEKTYYSRELPWDEEFYEPSYFLKNAINSKQELNNYSLVFNDPKPMQLQFYMKMLQDKGVNVSFGDFRTLVPGDRIIVCEQNIKDYLLKKHTCKVLGTYYRTVQLMEIQ